MLEVRRGIAAKNYENSFFREFAKNLSQMFNKYRIDGLLIGNSECSVENRLQIDALLVTQNAVCIIDFKNFEGEICLPKTCDFLYGRWTNKEGKIIKGGSFINPYYQLKKQRERFYRVFNSNIESNLPSGNYFTPAHTVRVVCFQKEIQLNGRIPSKDEVNFKIIHLGNYLEKIKDIIDVNDREVNLKKDCYPNFLDVFEADVFDLEETYGKVFDYNSESSELNFNELREDQKSALGEFDSFLKNDDERVFVLQGTSNSGKTHLIPFLRDLSFKNEILQVEILAPSSRIAKNLVRNIEGIGSLYQYIYGGNKTSEHEDDEANIEQEEKEHEEIDKVPLKKSYDEENALFIIDESQLISDSYYQSMDLKFGSGYLLKDFIEFLNIDETKRKIVFIGDGYQISLGKSNENPLFPSYLTKKYNLQVRSFELDDNPENNIILENALSCIIGLRQNLFNKLAFDFSKNFYSVEKNQVKSIITQYFNNSQDFKFLTYTNEEAQKVNLWIKKNIRKNGEDLSNNDLLILNNTISAGSDPFSKPQKVYNGQFFITQSYGDPYLEEIKLKGSKTVKLFFREITLKLLKEEASVKLLSLENYRNNPKAELSKDEIIAIKILLNRELKRLQLEDPFEKSSLYQNLVKSDEYKSIEDELHEFKKRFDSGEKVKTKLESAKRQRRVLTNKAKREYRIALEKKLMKDPSSQYYKIKNSALLKFGWAITVYKAMSYKWDNVLFNVDCGNNRGIANASYFKWLYTGITRAKKQIHLLNYKEITPTLKIDFRDAATDTSKKKDYYAIIDKEKELTDSDVEILNRIHMNESENRVLIVELYKIVESKLHSSNLYIKTIEHPNYQQVYTFADGSNDVKIRFYYDRKLCVKSPSIQSGQNEELNKLAMDLLTKNHTLNDFSIIKDAWRRYFYEFINTQLCLKGLYVQSIVQNRYKDFVSISSDNEDSLRFEVNYNGDGFFTSVTAKHYSNKGLWNQLVEIIKSSNHEQ